MESGSPHTNPPGPPPGAGPAGHKKASGAKRLVAGIVFVALFLAINAAIDRAFLLYRIDAGYDVALPFRLDPYPDRYRIAILGDSRSLCHVNPHIIGDDCINLAALWEGYAITYYKLRDILDQSPQQLRTVVLPVDRHSFSASRESQHRDRYWAPHADMLDITLASGHPLRNLVGYIKNSLFAYANLPTQLDRFIRPGELEWPLRARTEKGYLPLRTQNFSALAPEQRKEAAKRMAGTVVGPDTPWWCDEMGLHLRRILGLCRDRGIQVVLVRYPITPEFDAALNQHIPAADYQRKVDQILAEFPGTPLLDYTRLYLDRPDLFSDPGHLNDTGATAFSERLRQDLQNLAPAE